ncbi:MAG: MerR family DNA-binding transcriptional regulator [Steroidobacteraceae bacterium]
MTEIGADLGVSARTMRFYEDKGLIAPRRVGNNRVYMARDRARMILILRGKKLGFTLREIKEYLDLYDADPTQAKQLKLLLRAIAARIAQLEEQQSAVREALSGLRAVQAQARRASTSRPGRARRNSDPAHLPPLAAQRPAAGQSE